MIEFKNIYKIYTMGDNEVRAVDGISFKIEKGEFVAIVGQSGSGKSTCMNIIGALDVPTSGEYLLNGKDISHYTEDQLAEIRNCTLGFIFQQYNLISKLNVYENVEIIAPEHNKVNIKAGTKFNQAAERYTEMRLKNRGYVDENAH